MWIKPVASTKFTETKRSVFRAPDLLTIRSEALPTQFKTPTQLPPSITSVHELVLESRNGERN
jgi:hypothetical protein